METVWSDEMWKDFGNMWSYKVLRQNVWDQSRVVRSESRLVVVVGRWRLWFTFTEAGNWNDLWDRTCWFLQVPEHNARCRCTKSRYQVSGWQAAEWVNPAAAVHTWHTFSSSHTKFQHTFLWVRFTGSHETFGAGVPLRFGVSKLGVGTSLVRYIGGALELRWSCCRCG